MVTVGIDPGHGGIFHGCASDDGVIVEKLWTLEFCLELAKRIEKAGHKPMMTRWLDEYVPFWLRGRRTVGADVVVSIHVNAHPRPDVRGSEVYHWPGSVRGREMAERLRVYIPQSLQPVRVWSCTDDPATTSDDWIQQPKTVLRPHKAPAVLLEVGYATNAIDRMELNSADTIDALLAAVVHVATHPAS